MSHRSPMSVVVWAAGLFTVAGIGFAKLAEDFACIAGGAYALLVAAAAVALLALVAAAAPSAVSLLRGRDPGAWKYVAVPVVGAAVWFGILRLALAISAGHRVRTAPNMIAFLLIAVTGIAVVAGAAWAANRVLHRVPATQPARLRPLALTVVAAGMAVTTIAALLWGLAVHSGNPAGFRGDHGILATPFVPSWISILVAMAAATAMAASAGRRQMTAIR